MSTSKDASMRSAYRSVAVLAIVLVAVLRLVYLARFCPFDLAPDEAHYWDWSRHLDWSYYSKGPLIALIIRGAIELFGPMSIALTGSEMFAVRIPAVLCGSLLVGSLYVLTVQTTRSDRAAFLLTLTALAFPVVAAGSTFMTIDAPFMALWGWALVTAHEAVFNNRRWAWPATGLLLGLGILVKHIMILWLPCFGLFLLLTPARRGLLLTAGYWRMTALAFLGAVPILWWNSQHEWVMFFHERSHASHGKFFPLGPIAYLGTQAAILLGFWFVAWILAAIRYVPGRVGVPEPLQYLWCMSAPIVAIFGAFAFTNGGGEPNWPMAGYLAGGVLVAAWMLERSAVGSLLTKRILVGGWVACGLLGLVGTVVLHEPIWFQPVFESIAREPNEGAPMPLRAVDPTCRIRGYKYLAGEVDKVRAELAARGDYPVLAATAWTLPGELGFYCDGHPTFHGIGPAVGDRHSQYDLWRPNPLADPAEFRGKTFLIVVPGLLPDLKAFDEMEEVRYVHYREGKNLIAIWTVTVGHGFRGFPKKAVEGF